MSGSTKARPSSVAQKSLCLSSSLIALVMCAPQLASAQAPLPTGCVDSNPSDPAHVSNNVANAGETITCVAAAPDEIATLRVSVEDITVVIGSTETPTQAGTIVLAGGGASSVNIVNSNSTVNGQIFVGSSTPVVGATIQSEGAINTVGDSVYVRNDGGATVVSVTDVTAVSPMGSRPEFTEAIRVRSRTGSTDVSITATGGVNSDGASVDVQNLGSGNTTIEIASATSELREAISVYSSGSDVSITANGILRSNGNRFLGRGVRVRNVGSGDTTVSVSDISAPSGYGVDARNEAAGDLSITASGAVTVGDTGVWAYNAGGGDTTISVTDVTGASRIGIRATNGRVAGEPINGGLLSITASGAISSGDIGIYASGRGGPIAISAVDVTSASKEGIRARASFNNRDMVDTLTDISIESTGVVDGFRVGISASQGGNGAVTINANTVMSYQGNGIETITAYDDAANDISITVSGDITAGLHGVSVMNRGSGVTKIAVADVTAAAQGINASNGSLRLIRDPSGEYYTGEAGGLLSITASGAVSSGSTGIGVSNNGGGIEINVADVTSTNSTGISALTRYSSADANAPATDIMINSNGVVDSYRTGISASQSGNGDVTINAASIRSAKSSAISAFANESAGDIAITATGDITAGSGGVGVRNRGSGVTKISVADVTTATGNGVVGRNGSLQLVNGPSGEYLSGNSGGLITLKANGTISAGSLGVFGDNFGGGIEVSAVDVTSLNSTAIFAITRFSSPVANAAPSDITIETTGVIDGFAGGVYARQYGDGAVSVNASSVRSANEFASAVAVRAGEDAGDIAISVSGGVSSGGDGVTVANEGSGIATVEVADVTADNRSGVSVRNGSLRLVRDPSGKYYTGEAGGLVSVTATGAVSAGQTGIYAGNRGGGIDISAADVTSVAGAGIAANARYLPSDTNAPSTDIKITSTGAIDSYLAGIRAFQLGNGAVAINAGGINSARGQGVNVLAQDDAGSVSVALTGAVSSYYDGVSVSNGSRNAVDISTAAITSASDSADGIDVSALGGDVSVTATGAILSGDNGVEIEQRGIGGITVNTAGVTSRTADGVNILTYTSSGNDISVSATDAISAHNTGVNIVSAQRPGATTISVTDISATYGDGVYLDVRAGDISVTASGAISANGDLARGVNITQRGPGDAVIDVSDVTAGDTGIDVLSYGTGATAIAVNNATGTSGVGLSIETGPDAGAVTVSSTGLISGGYDGVDIDHYSNSAVSLTVGNVTGVAGDGIYIANNALGGGDISITASGAVSGGYDGIAVYNTGSGVTTITLENGASLTGAMQAIRVNGDASNVLNLAAGASINSVAMLGSGDDVFNADGLDFAVVVGGDGSDTVNFNGAGALLTNSGGALDSLREFETFNFNRGGFSLAGTHIGLDATNFNAGVNGLTGTLNSTTVLIASGATLNAADGVLINGSLTNNGLLNVGDSPGVLTINGDLTLGSTSVLPIEAGVAGVDQINVSGDVSLGGILDVVVLGRLSMGSVSTDIITSGGVISGAFDQVTFDGVSGGLLLNYQVSQPSPSRLVLTTAFLAPSTLSGLTTNQAGAGDGLIGSINASSTDIASLALGVATIPDIQTLGAVLEELAPEALDMGLKAMWITQDRFINAALDPMQLGSNGEARGDSGVLIWSGIVGAGFDQDESDAHIGFDGNAYLVMAGISMPSGPERLGLAGAYSNFSAGSDESGDGLIFGDSMDCDFYHVAGTVSADFELAGLAAGIDMAVAYADGDGDASLIQSLPNGVSAQNGEGDFSSLDLRTRFSLKGGAKPWPIIPFVEMGWSNYTMDAFDIDSGGASALAVEALDNIRMQLGVGAIVDQRLSDTLRLEAQLMGIQYFDDTDNVFSARFLRAGDDSARFYTLGKEVEHQLTLDTALNYIDENGFSVKAGFFGAIGDVQQYGARLRISKGF